MSVTSSLASAVTPHGAPASVARAPTESSASTIETHRSRSKEPVAAVLGRIVRTSGRTPVGIAREYFSLGIGPGHLAWADYVNLRVFDDKFYAGADKKEIVGQKENRKIAPTINYRQDWYAVTSNKVVGQSYLAAYGFPTIPIKAIYAPNLPRSRTVLCASDDLHRFLMQEENYPLFGKPLAGDRSLGSIALQGSRPETNTLVTLDGREIDARKFIAEIECHYSEGYLFQAFMKPHPTVAAICGDRLATLRIVTLRSEAGPTIFRACWKIPAGTNFADNYWRPGNLLGTIDRESGRLSRVTSGAGLDLVEVTHHPDTGASLVGAVVPDFTGATALAIEAARLMHLVPLIGWDIAVTDHGPVIVEMNDSPDLFLSQLADRQGALDRQLRDCIARQPRIGRTYARAVKAKLGR
jgi:Sugar-transfer associated ATP-grasp